jgi:hypothetical protein
MKLNKSNSGSFKKGSIPWNKGKKYPGRNTGEKNPMFGKIPWNKDLKGSQIAWNKGKICSQDTCNKISKNRKGKGTGRIPWNKGLTKETDVRVKMISTNTKERIPWNKNKSWSEDVKAKMRKPKRNTEKMKWRRSEDHIKIILKNPLMRGKPNKKEIALFERVQFISPNNYALNVKGDILIIGSKVPDIVNINGQKKLVELFGDYYHGEKITGRTKEQEERQRINYFKKFGWDTLIVWEHELKNLQNLESKLTEFFVM